MGSNWFPLPPRPDDAAWQAPSACSTTSTAPFATIAALSDAELRDPKKQRLIYGIAAHDLYHTARSS